MFNILYTVTYSVLGREEHITNNEESYRIFPLKKTITSSSELSFSVRAVISASVTYYTAPTKQTPRLIVSSDFYSDFLGLGLDTYELPEQQ